jgi:hypothetical protein
MKKLVLTAAAILLATAASAQMQSGGAMGQKDTMPSSSMSSDGITMQNGKMMMGDRIATKAEIAKHKKMMKMQKTKMMKPM